jgi:hypothetical protein
VGGGQVPEINLDKGPFVAADRIDCATDWGVELDWSVVVD